MKTLHDAKTDLKNLTKHTNNKLAILVSARSVIDSIYISIGSCSKCERLDTNECPISRAIMTEISKDNFFCADYKKAK